jgi:hypothetical protein
MRPAFGAAVARIARTVAAQSSAGSSAWPRIVRDAVRQLTPAMRQEIASANELTLQNALLNAVEHLKASST